MSIPLEPIDGATIPDPTPSDSVPNADGAPKRRGRPPGSKNATSGAPRSRRTAADKANVETALASMDTLYSAAVAGLLVFGKPLTSEMLATRIEQTQAANRKAFEASPKLAESIAKLGAVSSVGLFFGSNIALIGAVLVTFRMESLAAQQAAEAQQRRDGGGTPL